MRSPSVSSIYDGWRGLKLTDTYTFVKKNLSESVHILDFLKKSAIILASHVGVYRVTRFSSLPTNACSTEDNIPFPLFYLRGK